MEWSHPSKFPNEKGHGTKQKILCVHKKKKKGYLMLLDILLVSFLSPD